MTRRCWIVCPMLYDTESFLRVRSDTHTECVGLDVDLAFVVIDDSAGTDAAVACLDELSDVEVIVAPFNLGHQRAIVHALRTIAGRVADDDIVITMDSDGEDQPSDVPRLLGALDADGTSLALAQRTQRSESVPFRVLYTLYRAAFRLLTGTTVRSGNFAAQRADSLRSTIGHPTFDLCYSSSLLGLQRPTSMVPCARGHRYAGTSRMNAQSLMAHGIRMLLPFAERIAVRAMVLAAFTGTLLVVLLVAIAIGAPSSTALRVLLTVTAFDAVLFLAALTTLTSMFARFDHGRWSVEATTR